MEQISNHEQELDLMELIRIILQRWYLILLSVFLFLGATAFYAYNHLDDVYTSNSSIIVSASSDIISTNPMTDFQLSERMVNTYSQIITSDRVLDTVRTNLNLSYSNTYLRNNLTVRGVKDSILIDISLTMNDPVEAQLILSELVHVMEDLSRSEEINNLKPIDIWDTPKVPTAPSGPNRLLYLAIGVILGGMVGVFSIFLVEFLDKSIKGPKDLENKLNLRVLGIIPDHQFVQEGDLA
ncbi:YveK family protein [Liberiplasma polymorphum]|uniref:YveK family protein n=1 Tax=Liberiplasma polymorphum TaxID=3374570 RepID=UPI00377110B7